MPFVGFKEVLVEAKSRNSCVAAFNCYNFETIKTVINAGEQLLSPVVVMLYPALASHIPFSSFAHIVKDLADKSTQPVSIHLDHCDDMDVILAAVRAGFQSVIVDASRRGYEENVSLTRRVVKLIRPLGADIEAELGFVGSGSIISDYMEDTGYTDPALAKQFVEDTEIDCLAVAVGNAHGHYKTAPRLDITRLREIDRLTGLPLALHGGSGIPDAQLAEAAKNGVAKANFGTDFMKAVFDAQKAYLNGDGQQNVFGLTKAGETGGGTYAESRIRALGADHAG